MVHVFNPGNYPVVISEAGHVLGGGEHREVEALDAHGQHSVANGSIIEMDDEPEGDTDKVAARSRARKSKVTEPESGTDDSGASPEPEAS